MSLTMTDRNNHGRKEFDILNMTSTKISPTNNWKSLLKDKSSLRQQSE
jgi:hypothetical protein